MAITVAYFLLVAAAPPPTPAGRALSEWLAVFNAGDASAIEAFEKDRLGYDDSLYALDVREDTDGFELVEIEKSEPLALTALVRERALRGLQRVTLELESATSSKLRKLDYEALVTSREQALASTDALAKRLTSLDKFAGVVMITHDGKMAYEKTFGMADRTTKSPVRMDTPFFVASLGKMFTSVSILQLVEAGKIGLDDPVGKYLTDYPNRDVATKVTIRHLLTHRGGTGEMDLLGPDDGKNRAWVRTIDDLVKLLGARGLAFEPGTREEYSNYGFILLGAVIEKVSGQSYYDHVRDHVFVPAGMTATGYPTKDKLSGIAVGEMTTDKGLAPNFETLPWRGSPAGGGVSTGPDLLRFVDALQSGKLLSKAMLTEATKGHTPWYGLGFIVSPPADFPHWGHGGGAPGASLVLAIYPTINMTTVCMSNRDSRVCDRIALNYHYRVPRTPAP